VQEENLDCRYPVVLIPGLRVAQEVGRMLVEKNLGAVAELLEELDSRYELRLDRRDPKDILFSN
jgi:hypothetical protein